MKKLIKNILPPIFLGCWIFLQKKVFKNSKPDWNIVSAGPLKGLDIFVNRRIEYFAQMIKGTYDYYIYESIQNINLVGKTVLDIGSHIGHHSLGFSQLVGKKGKIYAFDPNPYNLERLEIIVKKNSINNIKICNLGISDTTGKSDFNFSSNVDDMTSSGGFVGGTQTPLSDSIYINAGFKKKKISLTTLDEFVNENELDNLSIIKIDVEGHEANVLNGGIEVLKKTSPIILVEIHTIKAMYDVDRIMKDIGYSSHIIYQEEDGRLFLKYHKN